MQKNSDFKTSVLNIVTHIPKGSVLSYKEVATRAGSPRAYRSVASIMSTNHNPKVPCHRVIHSDGRIGGYNRGGEEAKIQLLEQEGYKFK